MNILTLPTQVQLVAQLWMGEIHHVVNITEDQIKLFAPIANGTFELRHSSGIRVFFDAVSVTSIQVFNVKIQGEQLIFHAGDKLDKNKVASELLFHTYRPAT